MPAGRARIRGGNRLLHERKRVGRSKREIRVTFTDTIETLVRARYPILYVVSPEEARVHELLEGIAERRQKSLFEWSCTGGLTASGASIQLQRNRNSPTRDPLAALDQVIEQVEPAIFVFKDLHPFLTRNNHAVVRKLKEIALHLKNSFKTIVIVSPVLEVPVELEKEVTVLSLPLPRREELSCLLERITEEIRRFRQVKIELSAEDQERIIQAALGLTLGEAENAFARVLVRHERLTAAEIPEILEEKRQIVRKNGLLEYCDVQETFENVAGLDYLKDWLNKRTLAFSEEARRFGLTAPRGVLLVGVQGCGKSLCAKAVATHWQAPLLRFDVGKMFGSYVGSSEENIRRAIHVAESVAPAVLWVDEIDKAFAGASHGSSAGDGGTSARVLGTFLTWLSEKTAPVFVVATANEIANLPPELLRKGRLDEIFFVDLPTSGEREEAFAIHLRRRGRNPESFDLERLAEGSEGFSGAEIEEAVNSALHDAFYEGSELQSEHVLAAVEQSVPLSKTMSEELMRLRQWAGGRARPASRRD